MDKLFWKYFQLNNQDWNLTAKIYFTVAITSNLRSQITWKKFNPEL